MSGFMIEGGLNSQKAHVDFNNQLHTFSITETEHQHALKKGRAFNINTGYRSFTANTDSGILQYNHLEDSPLLIDAVAWGIRSDGTVSGEGYVKIIRNPLDTGTVFTDGTAAPMNANMNFAKNEALSSSLAYIGAEGKTIDGGTDAVLLQANAGARVYAGIPMELSKGNSIGFKINTYTTTGTTTAYLAMICHLKDPKND